MRDYYYKQALLYFGKEHPNLPESGVNDIEGMTYKEYMAANRRPTHRLYMCANYIYRAILGLDFTS